MINKIDENNYYDYTKLKNVNIPDTGEKFSLDYKKNEPPANTKDKKEASDSEKEKQQTAERDGVRLELSGSGRTAARGRQNPVETVKVGSMFGQSSLLDTVRTIFTTAFASVKDFFYKIWNDPQPSDTLADVSDQEEAVKNEIDNAIITVGAAETAETADSIPDEETLLENAETAQNMAAAYHMDKERLDREIQPYLRNGDLNQVISLLTDNGRKTIARNSTLLTYYDRNGRMTEPNASDRERILYGDRNTRKL